MWLSMHYGTAKRQGHSNKVFSRRSLCEWLSFHAIAKIVKVFHKVPYDWVTSGLIPMKNLGQKALLLFELDEMWRFLTSKKQTLNMDSVLSYYTYKSNLTNCHQRRAKQEFWGETRRYP